MDVFHRIFKYSIIDYINNLFKYMPFILIGEGSKGKKQVVDLAIA